MLGLPDPITAEEFHEECSATFGAQAVHNLQTWVDNWAKIIINIEYDGGDHGDEEEEEEEDF